MVWSTCNKAIAFLFCFDIALLVVFYPKNSLADSQQVHFSEIMWAGSSVSTADEWIELYNESEEVVDLSGWSIFDDVKSEEMLAITDGQIAPKGHFLIANNTEDHQFEKGKSVLNIAPDVVGSSVSLNNSNFKISLKSADDQTVETVGDGKKPFIGNSSVPSSMERIDFTLPGEDRAAWKECAARKNLDEGTPDIANPESAGRPKIINFQLKNDAFKTGSDISLELSYNVTDSRDDVKTIIVQVSNNTQIVKEKEYDFGESLIRLGKLDFCPKIKVTFIDETGLSASEFINITCFAASDQIKFYEFLPHPKEKDWNGDGILDTDDEWIELVNFGKLKVNLSGWSICDAGGDCYKIADQSIYPEGFLVFYKSETGISINDSGDTLYLSDPAGNLADQVEVKQSSSKYNQSYAKWGDKWFFTTVPTPGAVNQILQSGSKNKPDYPYLQEAEGKKVKVSARVIELDRSGVTVSVDSKPVMVKSNTVLPNVEVGAIVDISGIAHSGSMPWIAATSLTARIKSKANVSVPPGDLTAVLSSVSSEGNIKTTKTKRTKRLVINTGKVKPLVLGSSNIASQYFNYLPLVLYFSGALGFLMVVLIYDFCCRK